MCVSIYSIRAVVDMAFHHLQEVACFVAFEEEVPVFAAGNEAADAVEVDRHREGETAVGKLEEEAC